MAATVAAHERRRAMLAVAHLQVVKVAEAGGFDVHDVELDVHAVCAACRHSPHTHTVGRVVAREAGARHVPRCLHPVKAAV